MIREIRGFAMLEGVRGAPPADLDALAELLSRLSVFAMPMRRRSTASISTRFLPCRRDAARLPLDALIVAAGAADDHKAVA